MGIIARYVYWVGHDAGGALPPVDVVAGVLVPDQGSLLTVLTVVEPADEDHVLVVVPPQWIGDWATGHRLAPGYQHVWRVSASRLCPLSAIPRFSSYRPDTLPISATGPRTRRAAKSG